MKLIGLVTCAATLALAGCGGAEQSEGDATPEPLRSVAEIEIDAGPFDSGEAYASALDSYCSDVRAVNDLAPAIGVSPAGIAAEYALYDEGLEASIAAYESVEPPEDLAEAHQARIDALTEQSDAYDVIVANDGEGPEVDEAFASLDAAFAARDEADEEIGLEVCGAILPPDVGEPEVAAAVEEADYARPSNTIEDAAEATIELMKANDCDAFAESFHSQAGVTRIPQATCDQNEEFANATELVGTVSYGPIAYAEFSGDENNYDNEWQYVVDEDGEYHITSIGTTDGGVLRAPLSDNDSDEAVAAAVEAIRADDPEALNETLTINAVEGPGSFVQTGESFDALGSDEVNGPALVEDIRADEDAAPELLGIDQGRGVYLLEANGSQYALTTFHDPGSQTAYGFNGYWALPGAE